MKYNKSEIMRNAWAIRRAENVNMSSSLKKAWARAKNKEENTVENNEIKAIIDKYHLIRRGDKVGTAQTKGIDKAEFMREVGARKAEIIAYFDAQEKAAKEKREREYATFQAIPGIKDIQNARSQYAAWKAAFNRMMETGSSKMPAIEHKNPEEIAALEAQYPMAAFALEAQRRASITENHRLSAIWAKTYQDILDGQNVANVKADHDARMSEYSNSVMFG